MSRKATETRPALGTELEAGPELERRCWKMCEPKREGLGVSRGSSSSSTGERRKVESRSRLCARRRLRIEKKIHRIMEATARPTRRKTPATAAVFRKNPESLEEALLGLKVGLEIIEVTVTTVPLAAVETEVEVIRVGVGSVVEPRLSVVLMRPVLEGVFEDCLIDPDEAEVVDGGPGPGVEVV